MLAAINTQHSPLFPVFTCFPSFPLETTTTHLVPVYNALSACCPLPRTAIGAVSRTYTQMIDFLSSFIYFGYLLLTCYAFGVMTAAVPPCVFLSSLSLSPSLPLSLSLSLPLSLSPSLSLSLSLSLPLSLFPDGEETRGKAIRVREGEEGSERVRDGKRREESQRGTEGEGRREAACPSIPCLP